MMRTETSRMKKDEEEERKHSATTTTPSEKEDKVEGGDKDDAATLSSSSSKLPEGEHATQLPSTDPAVGGTGASKKRALCARACSACRKAHKACENERPCRRCVARGNEQACLREAASMSDVVRIHDPTTMMGGASKRKLVPILKRRRLDGTPELAFDPTKTFTHTVRGATIIQTLLPRPPANSFVPPSGIRPIGAFAPLPPPPTPTPTPVPTTGNITFK